MGTAKNAIPIRIHRAIKNKRPFGAFLIQYVSDLFQSFSEYPRSKKKICDSGYQRSKDIGDRLGIKDKESVL